MISRYRFIDPCMLIPMSHYAFDVCVTTVAQQTQHPSTGTPPLTTSTLLYSPAIESELRTLSTILSSTPHVSLSATGLAMAGTVAADDTAMVALCALVSPDADVLFCGYAVCVSGCVWSVCWSVDFRYTDNNVHIQHTSYPT